MLRVKVLTYKIENGKYGPEATDKVKSTYQGDLLAIAGLADRVVYIIATKSGEIKEEVQGAWKKIMRV
jgi:hypothetical protein